MLKTKCFYPMHFSLFKKKMLFSTKLLGEATKSFSEHTFTGSFVDKSRPGTPSGCCAEAVLNKACNDCFPLEASVQ